MLGPCPFPKACWNAPCSNVTLFVYAASSGWKTSSFALVESGLELTELLLADIQNWHFLFLLPGDICSRMMLQIHRELQRYLPRREKIAISWKTLGTLFIRVGLAELDSSLSFTPFGFGSCAEFNLLSRPLAGMQRQKSEVVL